MMFTLGRSGNVARSALLPHIAQSRRARLMRTPRPDMSQARSRLGQLPIHLPIVAVQGRALIGADAVSPSTTCQPRTRLNAEEPPDPMIWLATTSLCMPTVHKQGMMPTPCAVGLLRRRRTGAQRPPVHSVGRESLEEQTPTGTRARAQPCTPVAESRATVPTPSAVLQEIRWPLGTRFGTLCTSASSHASCGNSLKCPPKLPHL